MKPVEINEGPPAANYASGPNVLSESFKDS